MDDELPLEDNPEPKEDQEEVPPKDHQNGGDDLIEMDIYDNDWYEHDSESEQMFMLCHVPEKPVDLKGEDHLQT